MSCQLFLFDTQFNRTVNNGHHGLTDISLKGVIHLFVLIISIKDVKLSICLFFSLLLYLKRYKSCDVNIVIDDVFHWLYKQ